MAAITTSEDLARQQGLGWDAHGARHTAQHKLIRSTLVRQVSALRSVLSPSRLPSTTSASNRSVDVLNRRLKRGWVVNQGSPETAYCGTRSTSTRWRASTATFSRFPA
jgi:hypothetical protein